MPNTDAGSVDRLTAVTRALAGAVDEIEALAADKPDIDLLARSVPTCIQLAGLLAALLGSLGSVAEDITVCLPGTVVDSVVGTVVESSPEPLGMALLDVAADLATMRSLLHRAALVGAPAVADLRRCRLRPV
ncbi:MAG TPA: hypothetical protein VHV49_14325 [Pseudonocardiaceae bacterium]|jgi:hypothetical protein|nr:hypothetical protein [Pseudonocardiaceae bacterium]